MKQTDMDSYVATHLHLLSQASAFMPTDLKCLHPSLNIVAQRITHVIEHSIQDFEPHSLPLGPPPAPSHQSNTSNYTTIVKNMFKSSQKFHFIMRYVRKF